MNIIEIKNILIDKVIPFVDITKSTNLLKNKIFFIDFVKKYPIFKNFSELRYLINNINNLENLHIFCPICGNKNNFIKMTIGYSHHCSTKCAHNSEEVRNKTQKTCIERYGAKYITQSETMKIKAKQTKKIRYNDENYNNREKNKSTKLLKYGDPNYHNIEKMKITNLEKYGKEYYTQTELYKVKSRKTNLTKYGVDNVFKSNIIKTKSKETKLERYGVEHLMQLESYKQNYKKVCMEKYGVKNGLLLGERNKANRISKLNKDWGDFLNINKEDYEFCLNGKFYDLKKNNNLIEINPSISHNSLYGVPWVKDSKPLSNDYHFNKSKNGTANGYRVIHIWDWDDKEKIKNLLSIKTKLYARNCELKGIDKKSCDKFLNLYHLQNTCKGQIVRYGLFYNNILVQVMTFGKSRYNKNFEWELLRLCTHKDYMIVGGSEKLFKYFLKNNRGNIISYCDNSKFNGSVYTKLGFNIKSYGRPSKHWFNIRTKQHINNSLLLKIGFDKLFNTNFGKGVSNENLMIQNGFVYVYDCGQSIYEFTR